MMFCFLAKTIAKHSVDENRKYSSDGSPSTAPKHMVLCLWLGSCLAENRSLSRDTTENHPENRFSGLVTRQRTGSLSICVYEN